MFLASGGALVDALGALLGLLGSFLGPLGAILGRLEAVLGHLGAIWSPLEALLDPQEGQHAQIIDFLYVLVRFGVSKEGPSVWYGAVARLQGGVRGGDIIM